MTPDQYVKSMSRYIKLGEAALINAFLEQREKLAAFPPLGDVEADHKAMPKKEAIMEQIGLINQVLSMKFRMGIYMTPDFRDNF